MGHSSTRVFRLARVCMILNMGLIMLVSADSYMHPLTLAILVISYCCVCIFIFMLVNAISG